MKRSHEVDVFLEFSWFFYDPTDVGNLISGSSAFSKSSLNIWKFTVHVLLKPGLENFEHYFATVWDECYYAAVWAFLTLPFLGIGMKTELFQSCISHDVLCIEVKKAGWQYTALTYSFSYLEPVCCSISSSNCCFLNCIQISQEAGQEVWYAHLKEFSTVCCDPHS